MEVRSYIKNLEISPKKLRFLLPKIKELSPQEAMDELMYTPKKPARMLYSAVKSAIDNAKNVLKVDPSLLKFKLFTVEEGKRLKRFRAGGRGTTAPFRKRLAHIKIVLETNEKKESMDEETKPKVQSSNLPVDRQGTKSNPKTKLQVKKKK